MTKIQSFIFKTLITLAFVTPYVANALDDENEKALISKSQSDHIMIIEDDDDVKGKKVKDLAKAFSKNQDKRIATVAHYAKNTNMQHIPMMFAGKEEIEEHYREDVKKAEKFDRDYEALKRQERSKRKRANSDSTENEPKIQEVDDEGVPVTKTKNKRQKIDPISSHHSNTKKKVTPKSQDEEDIEEDTDVGLDIIDAPPKRDFQRLRKISSLQPTPSKFSDKFIAPRKTTGSPKKKPTSKKPAPKFVIDDEEYEDHDSIESIDTSSSEGDDFGGDLLDGMGNHDVVIFHNKKGKGVSRVFTREATEESPKFSPMAIKTPVKKPSTSIYKNAEFSDDFEGTIVIYDTETTTLSPKCGGRLCEVAGIKVVNGVPRETLHIFLNPDAKSWDGAFKAHGLSESFLRTQAHFYGAARSLEEFFGDHLRCAHNGFRFDDPYLMYEMRRARIFYQLKRLLDPTADLGNQVPQSIEFDFNKVEKGHELLKKLGIINGQNKGPRINLDQQANLLASAAMLYFFKDHMSSDKASNDKPGPMMFRDGKIMPDQERYKDNYEAATNRLAWFRLIRAETDTYQQRQKLRLPHEKSIRDAIGLAEVYISAFVNLLNEDIISEAEFKADPLDVKKMFDTLVFAREHPNLFTRGFNIDNLKLDSLLDYYGISRHARETGNHGAGIDTNMLFQVVRKLHGYDGPNIPYLQSIYQKNQVDQENYFFQKNSIRRFDKEGKLVETIQLHDDGIKSTTNQRSVSKPTPVSKPSFVPQNNPYRGDYVTPKPPTFSTPIAVAARVPQQGIMPLTPHTQERKTQEEEKPAQLLPQSLSIQDLLSQIQVSNDNNIIGFYVIPQFNTTNK